MRATIDKAGRVVIPAAIRRRAGLDPKTELDIQIAENGILISRVVSSPELVQEGKLLVARPTVARRGRPKMDAAELVREERERWPW
ncbi:MAG: AbrB/MazE/SpoVT family DNA-binding domain-containing protein [Salinisphaera sp.]|nr:AbrB/MazE/SpoVT family DNA-binding domain-containing protein [Salinisphaera sp.]